MMKSILHKSFRYTSSSDTDLRKTFARIRREQRQEANPDGGLRLSHGDDVDDNGHCKGDRQPAVNLPNPHIPVHWDLPSVRPRQNLLQVGKELLPSVFGALEVARLIRPEA